MNIRPLKAGDKDAVFEMMREFYNSPAIIHTSSDAVLMTNIESCISDMPFVDGYVMEENGNIIGYSMTAKSYSTEYGGICIWIEDIYLKKEYRGKGLVKQLFEYIEKVNENNAVRYRLEVEKNNSIAIKAYKNQGYNQTDYIEMTKEI